MATVSMPLATGATCANCRQFSLVWQSRVSQSAGTRAVSGLILTGLVAPEAPVFNLLFLVKVAAVKKVYCNLLIEQISHKWSFINEIESTLCSRGSRQTPMKRTHLRAVTSPQATNRCFGIQLSLFRSLIFVRLAVCLNKRCRKC